MASIATPAPQGEDSVRQARGNCIAATLKEGIDMEENQEIEQEKKQEPEQEKKMRVLELAEHRIWELEREQEWAQRVMDKMCKLVEDHNSDVQDNIWELQKIARLLDEAGQKTLASDVKRGEELASLVDSHFKWEMKEILEAINGQRSGMRGCCY
jgi:hypothetical protein